VEKLQEYVVSKTFHYPVVAPLILATDFIIAGNSGDAERKIGEAEKAAAKFRRAREHEEHQKEARRKAAEARGAVPSGLKAILREGLHGSVEDWKVARPLVAATDAGVRSRTFGYGYLVCDGRYGLGGHQVGPDSEMGSEYVCVAELQAVVLLVSRFGVDAPIKVLIDNDRALRLLLRWQGGDTSVMPNGYKGSDLRPLAKRLSGTDRIAFGSVKGHSGHVLNEAADSLARLVIRRLDGRWIGDLTEKADDIAAAFAAAWNAGPKHLRQGRGAL
jgi:ribonuclease HI